MANIETTEGALSGRGPGDGECRYCGSTPAVMTTQQSARGFLAFYGFTTWRGYMCRACAEAIHRHATAQTMTWAWWGAGVVIFWMFLLGNALRMRAVRRLDHPRRTPGAAAPLNEPMPLVEPWFRRRAPLVATCVGAGIWLLLGAFVVAELVSG